MVENTHAMTMAVCHALDVGFNSGKGNILDKWTKAVLGEDEEKSEKPKEVISDRAMAFFNRLPRTCK